MNIKRLMVGGLAALAAGSTLAFGIFATSTSLKDFVVTGADGMSLTSPVIVIGNPAQPSADYAKDVVGAADIAAAVAGYATTSVATSGGVSTSVTGGVALDTANTKMYLGDATNKGGLKTTITATELPTILGSKSFEDKGGTKYTYDQYVRYQVGSGSQNLVAFTTSGGDLGDPAVLLDVGQNANNPQATNPIYNLTVNFNKPFVPNATNSVGSSINLFGVKYTVGSASLWNGDGTAANNQLILFGSANSQVLQEGAAATTVTVNGKDYTVALGGVSTATAAVITVNGETRSVTKGSSYTIQGLDVYIDDLYYFSKQGQTSSAKLSFGTSKLTFTLGQAVKKGQSDDTVDNTLVYLSGGTAGISSLTIAATAKNANNDAVLAGNCWSDPVFATFKTCFNGLSGGDNAQVTVNDASSTSATVKFTDYRGNEKTFQWLTTPTASFVPQLNASTSNAIHVIEGEAGAQNDYWLLSPERASADVSDFGHIVRLSTVSGVGTSSGYLEFADYMSGETSRVYLQNLTSSDNYNSTTFYLDGTAFYVANSSGTGARWTITWGSGALIGNNGTKITLYPLVPIKGGSWLTLYQAALVPNTSNTTSGILDLPTNISVSPNAGSNSTAGGLFGGRVLYNFTDPAVGFTNVTIVNNFTQGGTGGSGGVGASGIGYAWPAVLLLEDKGKNLAGTDVHDAVFMTTTNSGTTSVDVDLNTPGLSAATQFGFTSLNSDNTVSQAYDRYGTKVAFKNNNQDDLVDLWVPDNQAIAGVALGPDPKFTSAAGGTTVETAVKIKSPVTKLASEINTAALSGDLILIGGPCANSLVATLMAPTTCDKWAYKTGVIMEVANAFSSGHKALIVAGTKADDTRWLASQVMNGVLSYST